MKGVREEDGVAHADVWAGKGQGARGNVLYHLSKVLHLQWLKNPGKPLCPHLSLKRIKYHSFFNDEDLTHF